MPEANIPALFVQQRPTIQVDGQNVPALTTALLSLEVEETTAGLAVCRARFINWGADGQQADYLFFDRDLLDFGKPFSVHAGEPDKTEIFAGRIMGLQADYPVQQPPEIVVHAQDRLQDLRMTHRTRSFEEATLADLVRQIAAGHGLAADISLQGPTYPVLAQVNQSDLGFLRDLARAHGAEIWVKGSTLFAASRTGRDAGRLTLTYGRELIQFTALADLTGQRTSLTMGGWDVLGKDAVAFEAGDSALGKELSELQSGGAILRQEFGPRPEPIGDPLIESAGEAQMRAKARFRSRARRFVTGAGLAKGNPRICVGTRVNLRDLGPLFDGAHYVSATRHTYNPTQGYLTEFHVERAGIGRPR